MSKPGQPKEGTKTRGEARGSAGGQKGLPREGGNTPGNRPRARKQTWPLNTYRRKKAPWYTKLRGPVAPKPKFDVDRASDYRTAKQVESAAIVVVGNEIVLGKRRDINSHYFAQYCKNLAIRLGKIEVVRDDEGDM
ncbi:hypothetical protein FRB99_002217 [Tulasnella sp. 403]|nr:hypothetical protein FRB99_002217 [Tulasnella sp. 403]